MTSLKDALLRKNTTVTVSDGTVFPVTRPSALDLIEAVQVANQTPDQLGAWLVARHLVEDGKPVFSSAEEVMSQCDAYAVAELGLAIEHLYKQGKA